MGLVVIYLEYLLVIWRLVESNRCEYLPSSVLFSSIFIFYDLV